MAFLDVEGWELESAVARAAANPASFEIPSREEREHLIPGQMVKLLFLFLCSENREPIVECERMWVTITEIVQGGYVGQLESHPTTSDALQALDRIEFSADDVAAVFVRKTDPGYPDWIKN